MIAAVKQARAPIIQGAQNSFEDNQQKQQQRAKQTSGAPSIDSAKQNAAYKLAVSCTTSTTATATATTTSASTTKATTIGTNLAPSSNSKQTSETKCEIKMDAKSDARTRESHAMQPKPELSCSPQAAAALSSSLVGPTCNASAKIQLRQQKFLAAAAKCHQAPAATISYGVTKGEPQRTFQQRPAKASPSGVAWRLPLFSVERATQQQQQQQQAACAQQQFANPFRSSSLASASQFDLSEATAPFSAGPAFNKQLQVACCSFCPAEQQEAYLRASPASTAPDNNVASSFATQVERQQAAASKRAPSQQQQQPQPSKPANGGKSARSKSISTSSAPSSSSLSAATAAAAATATAPPPPPQQQQQQPPPPPQPLSSSLVCASAFAIGADVSASASAASAQGVCARDNGNGNGNSGGGSVAAARSQPAPPPPDKLNGTLVDGANKSAKPACCPSVAQKLASKAPKPIVAPIGPKLAPKLESGIASCAQVDQQQQQQPGSAWRLQQQQVATRRQAEMSGINMSRGQAAAAALSQQYYHQHQHNTAAQQQQSVGGGGGGNNSNNNNNNNAGHHQTQNYLNNNSHTNNNNNQHHLQHHNQQNQLNFHHHHQAQQQQQQQNHLHLKHHHNHHHHHNQAATETPAAPYQNQAGGAQQVMAHYKFHNDCQSSVLTYEQVKRLDHVMDQVVPIHGRGNAPTLYVKLKELIRLVKQKLQNEHSIEIRDVRLNGGAASYVLAPENSHYNDLDLIFGTDLSNEDRFDVIRYVVLECLMEFHPDNRRQHDHAMTAIKQQTCSTATTEAIAGAQTSQESQAQAQDKPGVPALAADNFTSGGRYEAHDSSLLKSVGSSARSERSASFESDSLNVTMNDSELGCKSDEDEVDESDDCQRDDQEGDRARNEDEDDERRDASDNAGASKIELDSGVEMLSSSSSSALLERTSDYESEQPRLQERGIELYSSLSAPPFKVPGEKVEAAEMTRAESGASLAPSEQQAAAAAAAAAEALAPMPSQHQQQQHHHQYLQMPPNNCAIREAYVHKMVKVNDDDRWSLISLGVQQSETLAGGSSAGAQMPREQASGCGEGEISGGAGKEFRCNFSTAHKQFPNSIELKFVDRMRRKFEFSVDSFQIILDSLIQFYDYAPQSTITIQRKIAGSSLASTMIDTARPIERCARCSAQNQILFDHTTMLNCGSYMEGGANNGQSMGLSQTIGASTASAAPQAKQLQFTSTKVEGKRNNENICKAAVLGNGRPIQSRGLLHGARGFYELSLGQAAGSMVSSSSVASSSGCSSSSSVVSSSSSSLSCDDDHEDLYCEPDVAPSSSCSTSSLLSSTMSASTMSTASVSEMVAKDGHLDEQGGHLISGQDNDLHLQRKVSKQAAAAAAAKSTKSLKINSKFSPTLGGSGKGGVGGGGGDDDECAQIEQRTTTSKTTTDNKVNINNDCTECFDTNRRNFALDRNSGNSSSSSMRQCNLVLRKNLCDYGTNRTSCAVISENFYPTVIGRSEYGNFKEALYHLEKKLIATRSPEEIRGGGLLKYCNLLVKNYKPTNVYQIRTLERYMCSRFFIDFSDLNQQRAKLESYLANHFSDDPVQKFDYLTILHNVVQRSTVCLMNHELKLTLNMIRELAYNLNEQQIQQRQQAAAVAAAAAAATAAQIHDQQRQQQRQKTNATTQSQ